MSARVKARGVDGIDRFAHDTFQAELAHRLKNLSDGARNSGDRRSGSLGASSRLSTNDAAGKRATLQAVPHFGVQAYGGNRKHRQGLAAARKRGIKLGRPQTVNEHCEEWPGCGNGG